MNIKIASVAFGGLAMTLVFSRPGRAPAVGLTL
jgi:hypothetical protein